jgi:sarcosine oxidase
LTRTDVDVVVVGRGAVAAATAWHLAGAGREVLLLARRGPWSPGPAAVASRSGEPADAVGAAAAALPLWRAAEAETGVVLLSAIGAVDHGAPARSTAVASALDAHGVPHTWLSPDEAGRRWPGMQFHTPVLHQPDRTGRVHAAQAARALAAAAVGRGAVLATTVTAREVVLRGDDHVVVATSGGRVRARRVLVVDGPRVRAGALGFPPRGVNPCVVQEHDWPVFTHHTGPSDGWPSPLVGVPDPCGDVLVGFETGSDASLLADYVSRMLPGLVPHPVVPPARGPVEDDECRLTAGGPVVAMTEPASVAYAPVIGRRLAVKLDVAGGCARHPVAPGALTGA